LSQSLAARPLPPARSCGPRPRLLGATGISGAAEPMRPAQFLLPDLKET